MKWLPCETPAVRAMQGSRRNGHGSGRSFWSGPSPSFLPASCAAALCALTYPFRCLLEHCSEHAVTMYAI